MLTPNTQGPEGDLAQQGLHQKEACRPQHAGLSSISALSRRHCIVAVVAVVVVVVVVAVVAVVVVVVVVVVSLVVVVFPGPGGAAR